jgi:predicted transcriptional regulator
MLDNSSQLTGNEDDNTRNVQPRVIREGPIRQSLSQVHLDEFEDLRDLYPPSESETSSQDIRDLTGDEQEEIVTVTALDPSMPIATEIDPLFRRHNHSFRYYARVLEQKMIALENKWGSYLTGGMAEEQLQRINDNLQSKLARLFHPMMDNLMKEVEDFSCKVNTNINDRLLTVERETLSRIEDQAKDTILLQVQSMQADIGQYHRSKLDELTLELQDSFVKAEHISSTKLYALQHEVVKDISKLDSRIGEIESNNVKDHTLTINKLQSIDHRLNILTEDIRLTNEEQ